DVRLFHAPEVSASTSVTLKFNGSSGDQLAVEFAAFSQQWRLATRLNRFLLPELLPAELRRASDGAILENRLRGADRDDLWEPLRGRLYIGTIRAYIVTNINDYMLNVPLANQTILKRLKNSLINSRNKTNVTVSGGEIKQLLGGGEIKQPLGGGEIKQPLGGGGGEIKQPLG
uniref:Type VI secretion system membrane subunit TssM n=1 Tax=Macrostomum lignano TaxID=282301 RepID=A0A1I8GY18_9PLAT